MNSIKDLRNGLGFTQLSFAYYLGIPRGTYVAIESGKLELCERAKERLLILESFFHEINNTDESNPDRQSDELMINSLENRKKKCSELIAFNEKEQLNMQHSYATALKRYALLKTMQAHTPKPENNWLHINLLSTKIELEDSSPENQEKVRRQLFLLTQEIKYLKMAIKDLQEKNYSKYLKAC